ncbi:MAG TPA: SBBP repeat-containing protein [Ruminiclostridium sp.]|nr:SBBP repeat-containing protein [Ruminiclostridium sp.]
MNLELPNNIPLSFQMNRGQSSPEVKFISRTSRYSMFLTDGQIAILPNDCREEKPVFYIKFIGTIEKPEVSGIDELPGKVSYFIGTDPQNWYSDIPTYERIKYSDLYPGVDLVCYGNKGKPEYDFIVQPGADFGLISMRFEGMDKLEQDGLGNIEFCLGNDRITMHKPFVYQENEGTQKEIQGSFLLDGKDGIKFGIGEYDASSPLIIDPVLTYSTYLGGGSEDNAGGSTVDASGCVYVTGYTSSGNFPLQNPVQSSLNGGYDTFVTKLDATGSTIIYSTYLGGNGYDYGESIAIDSSGNAYVTGNTNSANFPVQNPIQSANAGGYDAFITKLNSTGSAIIYSTYFGGNNNDYGNSIKVDASGNIYLIGETLSTNFPLQGPVQSSNAGGYDAFVTKLNNTGSAIVYSTYLGGSGNDYGKGIAVDSSGNAYIMGDTRSTDFPVQNPIQSANAGIDDVYVAKINPTGSALIYSTYLGGTNSDYGGGFAIDSSGCAYVMGDTLSTNFPVKNAIQTSNAGNKDIYITKLNAAGSDIVYSTYLGGSGNDYGKGIAVDSGGSAYIAGDTRSTDFPLKNAVQSVNGGNSDAFVVKLNALGSAIVYSTYMGGSSDDYVNGTAIDLSGSVYVSGVTSSTNFPVLNPLRSSLAGPTDAFVFKIAHFESSRGFDLSNCDQMPEIFVFRKLI